MIERPDTRFAIYRSPTVGDNKAGGISAMVLAGERIRGVIVDNPSGSWVKIDGQGLGFQPYIPPYTLAWSISLLPSVTELSAQYVVGPLGQIASSLGSPIVVYLFESQVPSSAGYVISPTVASISKTFLGVTTSAVANTQTSGILTGGAPGAGLRYRIFAFSATPNNTAQAAVAWRAACYDRATGIPVLEVSSANFGSPGLQVVPGGIPITANNDVGWSIQSALASLGLDLLVHTTTEAA